MDIALSGSMQIMTGHLHQTIWKHSKSETHTLRYKKQKVSTAKCGSRMQNCPFESYDGLKMVSFNCT